MKTRLASRATCVAVVIVSVTACSSRPRTATGPSLQPGAGAATDVATTAVPEEIAGLRSHLEDVTSLEEQAGPDSYLVDTRLWSLRSGDRPRATLQVSRFVTDAQVGDESFRQRVVAQIGLTAPTDRTIDGHTVYVTSSNQQGVYIWFTGPYLMVLSVAAEHPAPRALLRAALGVKP